MDTCVVAFRDGVFAIVVTRFAIALQACIAKNLLNPELAHRFLVRPLLVWARPALQWARTRRLLASTPG